MGSMSIVHWMIVIAVVVLLFGRGKISGLMGDVADGIKSFKKGIQEEEPSASASVSPEPQIEQQPLQPARTAGKVHEEA
jgi:sec-independent protein translocase protein TatA